MLKKALESTKALFGFRSNKQTAFDDAMLLILKAIADSRFFLTTQEPSQLDPNIGKELAHAWSESAVKMNRLNENLREECLALAKVFAEVNSWNSEQPSETLDQVDALFSNAQKLLEAGAK